MTTGRVSLQSLFFQECAVATNDDIQDAENPRGQEQAAENGGDAARPLLRAKEGRGEGPAGANGSGRRRFLPGVMRPKKTLEEVLAMRHARLARIQERRGEDADAGMDKRGGTFRRRGVADRSLQEDNDSGFRPRRPQGGWQAREGGDDGRPFHEGRDGRFRGDRDGAPDWHGGNRPAWQEERPRRGCNRHEEEMDVDDFFVDAPRGRAGKKFGSQPEGRPDFKRRPFEKQGGGYESDRARRVRGAWQLEDEAPAPPAHSAKPAPAAAPLRQDGVRLSRVMAERGLCSRREADELIERGWVCVNGVPVNTLGIRVSPDVEVTLLPEAERGLREQVTILLNKPVGYVSGQAEDDYQPAVELITPEAQYDPQPNGPRFRPGLLRGLAPAGRLDIDSTGLLVLTQNGRIARQLIGEDSAISKEYRVWVNGAITDEAITKLTHGLTLDGRKLRRANVKQTGERELRFILNEGRKRQIRRMCELVGLHVTRLQRIRVGRIWLDDLPLGQWRYLRPEERF